MFSKRTARDIMTENVITVKPDVLVTDMIKLFIQWHISGLPVVDSEANLLGIVTEYDIMNFVMSGDATNTTASEVMTKDVQTCPPDTLVSSIINSFALHRIRRVPIVEGRKVVGIVSRRDIVKEMDRIYSELINQKDSQDEHGHQDS